MRPCPPRLSRRRHARSRHRGAPLRRGPPRGAWQPSAGPPHRVAIPELRAGRVAASTAGSRTAGGVGALRPHAGQGDRLRPQPRRGGPHARPGRCRGAETPRADDQSRPARAHPAAPGIPGRRHRHRVPRAPRPGRARRPARRRAGAAPARGGGRPRRPRPGAGATPACSAPCPRGGATTLGAQTATSTGSDGRGRGGVPIRPDGPVRAPGGRRRHPRRRYRCRLAGPTLVVLVVGGVGRRYEVEWAGAVAFVDAVDGSSTLTEVERFPLPGTQLAAGALVAPLPGTVVTVAVGVGDAVAVGDTLVAIEAMKMEHEVQAPAAGTVAEVHVAPGEQVEAGRLLVVVDASTGDAPEPPDGTRPGGRRAADRQLLGLLRRSHRGRPGAARGQGRSTSSPGTTWPSSPCSSCGSARQRDQSLGTPAPSTGRWRTCSAPASTGASRWWRTPAASTRPGWPTTCGVWPPSSASTWPWPTSRVTTSWTGSRPCRPAATRWPTSTPGARRRRRGAPR